MKIVEALNEYFGTECGSIYEFRNDFDEMSYAHDQGWKLISFLMWLEEKQSK